MIKYILWGLWSILFIVIIVDEVSTVIGLKMICIEEGNKIMVNHQTIGLILKFVSMMILGVIIYTGLVVQNNIKLILDGC